MEEVEQNNPAGRLHVILSRAIAATNAKTPQGISAADLWAGIFDIPISGPLAGETLLEIISRVLQLDKLIDDTEANLRKIGNLQDVYFRPFNKIRAIPRHSLIALTSDISSVMKTISDGDLIALEFCSVRLAERHLERIVDENELLQILRDVADLFDDVQQSELDRHLKIFILDQLESIRRGIYEFRIRGPQRLKETMAEIIGTLAVNHDVIQAARSQDGSAVERLEKAFYRHKNSCRLEFKID